MKNKNRRILREFKEQAEIFNSKEVEDFLDLKRFFWTKEGILVHNSSESPNIQQIPSGGVGKVVRSLFTSRFRPGLIVTYDYKQAETRTLAMTCQERELLRSFRDGEDIYVTVISAVLKKPRDQITKEEREKGKVTILGTMYGITEYGISRQLKISVAEARKLINDFFDRFPNVKRYREFIEKNLIESGSVYSPSFRLRKFHKWDYLFEKKNLLESYRIRNGGINAPIQGASSDLSLINSQKLWKYINEDLSLVSEKTGEKPCIINFVHDSVMLDVPGSLGAKKIAEFLHTGSKILSTCPETIVKGVIEYYSSIFSKSLYILIPEFLVDVSIGPDWDRLIKINLKDMSQQQLEEIINEQLQLSLE